MTYRLFVDEVGNDDTASESERYLSLTGITAKVHDHDTKIHPKIEAVKNEIFGHNPPQYPVILHRKEKPFDCLQDPKINLFWEKCILSLMETLPYIVNTVLIDKLEHVRRYGAWTHNPYHYCMLALVERYVLWLRRNKFRGDVLAESRGKPEDKALKEAFRFLYEKGTDNIRPEIIQQRLTSREIKLQPKSANIGGLQLADVLANPSHTLLRCQLRGEEMKARFAMQIVEVLKKHRYARDPNTGKLDGWGLKTLP